MVGLWFDSFDKESSKNSLARRKSPLVRYSSLSVLAVFGLRLPNGVGDKPSCLPCEVSTSLTFFTLALCLDTSDVAISQQLNTAVRVAGRKSRTCIDYSSLYVQGLLQNLRMYVRTYSIVPLGRKLSNKGIRVIEGGAPVPSLSEIDEQTPELLFTRVHPSL